MDRFPLVISFYTKNTPYEFEVRNLIESCDRFGLDHSIEGIDSFGSWELNCAYKPFFILQKINQLKSPVLWIDADGVFLNKPSVISAFSADIATRINANCPDDHPSKVISSTVFVNHTILGKSLIEAWADECKKQLISDKRSDEFWDQIALRDIILQKKEQINIQALPLSYSRIYDHPQDLDHSEPSVIEHYQASRRFKKIINKHLPKLH